MPKPPVTFLEEELPELEHRELRVPDDFYADFASIVDQWFGGPRWRAKGTRLTLLATDASGGWYCLWWYPDLGDKRAPVVYMGSEGNGLSVIANGTVEFVEALMSGRNWEPGRDNAGAFVDGEDIVDPAKVARFAERAREEYGLTGRDPAVIVDEGRANHPDFAAWAKRQSM